jgi:hypothetical protein
MPSSSKDGFWENLRYRNVTPADAYSIGGHSALGRNKWRTLVLPVALRIRAVAKIALIDAGCRFDGDEPDCDEHSKAQRQRIVAYRLLIEHVEHVRRCAERRFPTVRTHEAALAHVRAAEVQLTLLLPSDELWGFSETVRTAVDNYLPRDDSRRTWLREWIGQITNERAANPDRQITPGERSRLCASLAAAYYYNTVNRNRLRTFQLILFLGTFALTCLLAGLVIWSANRPGDIPLCFGANLCPAGGGPSAWDLPLVGLTGLVGGSLAATFTLARAQGVTGPHYIRIAQAMLKAATGALTAILGLVLLHLTVISFASGDAILAVGLIFGYSQQVFTRLADRQADVLSQAADLPPKERPGKEPTEESQ